jgi:DNA replication and repair protein RecF
LSLNLAYTLGEKKQITINNHPITDRKDLLSHTPCILFCHDDIAFVKGSPERKRWFLNQTLGLFNPLFLDDLRAYNRILKMRNACLRDGKEDVLEALDIQLVRQGLEIMHSRRLLVREFSLSFDEYYRRVAGNEGDDARALRMVYTPSWREADATAAGVTDSVDLISPAGPGLSGLPESSAGQAAELALAQLKRTRRRDLRLGLTSTGPHRDNLHFFNGGREYTAEASTGQLRLMSLILRIAQAGFYHQKTRKKPILLLDDVLLELDPTKRRRLIENLPEYDQAFFTFLPEEKLLETRGKNPLILEVNEGALTQAVRA